MTLLDPPPVKPQKSRAIPFTISAVVVAAVVLFYFAFRYYPEKKAAERFFNALVAGNSDLAYQLWKPGPSYTKKDFLADWGPEGYYGPVKSYEILEATSRHGVLAHARRLGPGEEPQDQSCQRVGHYVRQVPQLPALALLLQAA